MEKSKNTISPEMTDAIREAVREGCLEAYGMGSRVNYFKATEALLRNYARMKDLVADEEGYTDVEYHAGKRTFEANARAKGYIERKTEDEIADEMREERRRQYSETKRAFEKLDHAVRLFENEREFCVIRMYYFGESISGTQRTAPATWEEIALELQNSGILQSDKTARRWRNRIVGDIAVCLFGLQAAISLSADRNVRNGTFS